LALPLPSAHFRRWCAKDRGPLRSSPCGDCMRTWPRGWRLHRLSPPYQLAVLSLFALFAVAALLVFRSAQTSRDRVWLSSRPHVAALVVDGE
jgi:hypothetical protein